MNALRSLAACVSAASMLFVGIHPANAAWPDDLMLSVGPNNHHSLGMFHDPFPVIGMIYSSTQGTGSWRGAFWITPEGEAHSMTGPTSDFDGEPNHGLVSINAEEITSGRVHVIHSLPGGGTSPALPGMLVINDPNVRTARVCSDGVGGFYVMWYSRASTLASFQLRLKRFTFEGVVVAGWPAQGILLANAIVDGFELFATARRACM